MVIDQTLENELYDNGIYEAWQFVINTVTTLSTARYCKETILRLLTSMQSEHEEWKEKLWNDLTTQEGKVKKVSITTESLPDYVTSIAEEDVPTAFLLNKLTKDFFQYSRCSATRFLRNRDRIVEKKSPILRSISEARSLASTAPQQGERPTQEGGLF